MLNGTSAWRSSPAWPGGWVGGVGLGQHEGADWDDDWRNIVFIDTPELGQISWHIHRDELPLFLGIPKYEGKWDGHDTEEKYIRVNSSLIADALPGRLP